MANQALLASVEKLTGRDNYNEWAFAMKAYLQHEDLWSCIEGSADTKNSSENTKRDLKAKSKIIMTIHSTSYIHVRDAATAKEAWDNLKTAYEDSGLLRKVGLMRKLITSKLDDHTSMEDYISSIMTTAQKLNDIGFAVNTEWVATFLLAGLSEEYGPMLMAIENSGVKITADLVKTKLLQEVKCNSTNSNSGENVALYTTNKVRNKKNKKNVRCYNCNNFGHFASECKKPNKK